MKNALSKNKSCFGYILYGILLTAALLYYRFPSDALREYIQATVERLNPGLLLSAQDISPSFPLGIRLKQTELSLKKGPRRAIFTADSLSFSPRIWSILKGDFQYIFTCNAYDGDLEGIIHFTKQSLGGPFRTSMELKDIHIDKNFSLYNIIGPHMEGSLSGTIAFSGGDRSIREGDGEADLMLSNGLIKLLKPVLGLESIDFNRLLLNMVIKKNRLNLSHLELKGGDMHGTASGIIYLKKEFLNSRLNLRGTLEPFADLFKKLTGGQDTLRFVKQRLKGGKLSFNIQGTIREPIFKFT